MPAKTKLAQVVAKEEGFGRPGVIPTLRNNPGDLRHSPHSEHPGGPGHADDIGTIDTVQDGWDDLERQLEIYAHQGLTLRAMVNVYCGLPRDAAPGQSAPDGNNAVRYLAAVCTGMDMPPQTLVADALKVPAI